MRWERAVILSLIGLATVLPVKVGSASMSGGGMSVPVFSTLSGGGSSAGGGFLLSAMNMGGASFSPASPSGGAFTLITGAAPALVLVDTAASGLGGAHCYPVPFKPSAGHTAITFTGLPRQASIKIYSLSGQLVRSLEKNDAYNYFAWDARNSRGARVASGVYIYTIKSGGQRATGKLMIIW